MVQRLSPDGDNIDGVYLVNPITGLPVENANADRELLSTRYSCKQLFAGANIGDAIKKTVALDVSGATMEVVSVLWENESTNSVISQPPNVIEYLVSLIQGDSLTLSQLLTAGLATANNQVTQIGYLADISQGIGRYASYQTQQVDGAIAGTVYVRKSGADSGDTWLIQRVYEIGTYVSISYAGIRNNSLILTSSDAWDSRLSLIYGELNAA